VCGVEGALSELCRGVAKGDSETCTQIAFARDLHDGDRYADAHRVLAGVLAREPDCAEASILGADIDVHEGENERAAATCHAVLARDPDNLDAWEVLADAERARRRWAEARDASTAALALRKPNEPLWLLELSDRARALLELGDEEALAADLEALARGNMRSKAAASMLGAMSLLRRSLFEEALSAARAGLAEGRTPFRAELTAIGLDAAHRLGRPEEAPAMPPSWRDQLRWRGHEAWIESLPVPAAPLGKQRRPRHSR
jgi:tetratricopeptide (TPR) repeat protein